MFVINQPTMSCCGSHVNNCSCGGRQNYEYSGRYAEDRPTPMHQVEEVYVNEFLEKGKEKPKQFSHSGSAARVDNSKPTPMPIIDDIFTNEFGSNRR